MPGRDSLFLDFARLIVGGSLDDLARCLALHPGLATTPAAVGATRKDPSTFFLTGINHHIYRGDTPLHVAAAAFRRPAAQFLVVHGADCGAKNRRGAEPLHYAADANHGQAAAQADTIEYLTSAGANPNAVDIAGVTPLHRAVRTRSIAAVRALIAAGADPRQPNRNGSRPLHLAVQNTGRGGSGTDDARQRQAAIVTVLLEFGATPADGDGRGRDAYQAATSEWVRLLLDGFEPADFTRGAKRK
jgi:ankyrin repeat protein